ncbi:MAG: hypothetical protein ACP5OA_05375 [Candidatus Woesearchaeota archaeon]
MDEIGQDIKNYHKLDISQIYLELSKVELIGLGIDGVQTWKIDNIYNSLSYKDIDYPETDSESNPYAKILRPEALSLPIIGIHNDKVGPAIWILSGMYGDEPSGPNMLARNIGEIAKALSNVPTVILPLCNPHGYRLNQSFLDDALDKTEGLSVDNASHVLIDDKPGGTRYIEGYNPRSEANSYEAEHIVSYLLTQNTIRPPTMVIDLQEIDSSKGHIESYGTKRYENTRIQEIVRAIARTVDMTQFANGEENQRIISSIRYPIKDNSIAEFAAAKKILYGGIMKGIGAKNVIKTRIPSLYIPLENRIQAQKDALYASIDLTRDV